MRAQGLFPTFGTTEVWGCKFKNLNVSLSKGFRSGVPILGKKPPIEYRFMEQASVYVKTCLYSQKPYSTTLENLKFPGRVQVFII